MLVGIKFGRKAGRYLFHALLLNGGVMILLFTWAISPLSSLDKTGAFLFLATINVIWGAIEALFNVPLNAKIQRAVPSELRGGRVFSAMAVMMHASGPLGLLAVGPLLDRFPAWKVALGLWTGMGIVVAYFWVRHKDVLLADVGDGDGKERNGSQEIT